jgi:hypothetical protein
VIAATAIEPELPPQTLIGDRLRRARRRRFVGRAAERELFRTALTGDDPPFAVLFVHGPGGVGKTALLGAFADDAVQAGVEVVRLDLRAVEPSPAGVEAALAGALGSTDPGSAAELLRGQRRVLLLDTYEAAAALDDWVRERFLAALPAEVLVVIAGRFPPGAGWTGDIGWHELLRVVSLRNLRPEDARALLHLHGTAPLLHDRAIELTHGHPLALSLVIDVLAQRPAGDAGAAIDLGDAPDVLRPLLERFVADVPGPRHLRALEACAHARFMTEDLLAAACGANDARTLFAWLRTLSFVDETRDGLFPHDLARDVLDVDLRWRDREAYDELHRAIRRRLVQRIRATSGREQQRAAADLVFLHRRNPFTSAFWDWASFGRAYSDELRPGDREAIVAMVERHESATSAALAAHWLERQPQAFWVFRVSSGEPIGFSAMLALHAASADELAADPGAQAMWEHALRHAPPRPGEEVYAGRFVVDRDHHQRPSASFNVVTFRSCQHWLSHPRLAWDFLGCWTDPAAIEPMMSYIDYERVPEADYEVGGIRYGVFAHDWRRVGADAWLDLMADRELEAGFDATLARGTAAPVLALSQPEFDSAARRALRALHRPDALAANPLLRTRVVQDREGAGGGPQVLRDLVEEAVGALRADPRDEKLVRAIERTYLRPAPTQERAAEVLGLPFSTYRRHLAGGVERVVDWLWQRELYGAEQ